ncbi:hypothetical protein JS533_001525 [Bifidobacterium amazonense]|uniref:Uncharacterized protein n=1 Tax=Bifidobacterium amazonense TaxID=2809027 RepID=A0ABS9VSS7_9BIFI|nr:hypothetical protein [Bifidobacterium amazonense]MCH9274969.1 hypothetical protein [Bifidobacterium amazonense]
MDDEDLIRLLESRLGEARSQREDVPLSRILIPYFEGIERRIEDLYSRIGELEDEVRRLQSMP